MVESDLLIDPTTGEVKEYNREAEGGAATCVRARLFCPKKGPGMSVGKGSIE